MKSAIIFAVIAFALCLSMVGFVRGEGTVVAVDPSSLNITQDQIGNNFTCSINITGVANLWAWSLRLNWNPTVLNATNLQEGPFLKTAGSTIFGLPSSKGPGYFRDISDTLLTASTANGSGILFNVTFEVLAVGHSDITLNETSLFRFDETLIPFTASNGSVTVAIPEFSNMLVFVIIFAGASMAVLIKKRPKHTAQRNS